MDWQTSSFCIFSSILVGYMLHIFALVILVNTTPFSYLIASFTMNSHVGIVNIFICYITHEHYLSYSYRFFIPINIYRVRRRHTIISLIPN